MIEYLRNLNQPVIYQDLVEYAACFHVPIIKEESLWLLKGLIKLIKPKRILEIGTAIGYSALEMASLCQDIKIDTIERDPKMQALALKNIEKYDAFKQINLIEEDALTLDLRRLANRYDLIFIDAAKAQYQKFFVKFSSLTNTGAIIVTDNIIFHNLVTGDHLDISKNTRSLVNKIDTYNNWLASLEDFSTTFLPIGDGLAISERIK